MKKNEAVVTRYFPSLNGELKASFGSGGFGPEVFFSTINHEAGIRSPRQMKATVRTVHANPMVLNSFWMMMGHTIPPMDDPEITMPVANPRRWLNQDWMVEIVG